MKSLTIEITDPTELIKFHPAKLSWKSEYLHKIGNLIWLINLRFLLIAKKKITFIIIWQFTINDTEYGY